jgi:hypothetical protein
MSASPSVEFYVNGTLVGTRCVRRRTSLLEVDQHRQRPAQLKTVAYDAAGNLDPIADQ